MNFSSAQLKPFHLLLFPLYFVTHKFFVLCRPFDPGNVTSAIAWIFNFGISFLYSVLPVFATFIILYKIIKLPVIKAAVITTLFIIFIYLEPELDFLSLYSAWFLRKRYLLLICLLIFILSLYRIYKSEKFTRHLNSYLNLLFAGLTVYNLSIVFFTLPEIKAQTYLPADSDFRVSCNQCPDIYYIVLDAYTSNESLKKYWNYDNSGFTDSLGSLGFYIADSRTKFNKTYYSMASTLNMSDDSVSINKLHRYEAMKLVRNNTVTRKLIEAGYEVINLSFFDIGNMAAYYGFSNAAEGNERSLFIRFLNNTILKSFTNFFSELGAYDQHMRTLEKLNSVSEKKGDRPKFVYTHLLAPHQPYVIDSASGEIPFYELSKSNSKSGYLNQLKGLNGLVLATVKKILNHYQGANKPIIIIQGDHGFRYLPENPEEGNTIMNVYYMPDNRDKLYKNISPYNTFRIIFNAYFNCGLKLLEEPGNLPPMD